MKISKENLRDVYITCGFSSGPTVYIFYSISDDNVYATMYHHPRSPVDKIICRYNPIPSKLDYIGRITKAIYDFKSPTEIRDIKIDKILGED